MATLHIIGNGFDLSHGFDTSYKNFREYAIIKDKCWVDQFECCYPDINPQSGEMELWCNLEHALGKIDFDCVFNEATIGIEPEEGHEIRFVPQMEDAPKDYLDSLFWNFHKIFEDWVHNITINGAKLKNIPHFNSNGLFISFNYTETLEKIYCIPQNKINYVHGRRPKDRLIVGHNSNKIDGFHILPDDPEIYKYEAYNKMASIFNKERKKISSIYGTRCLWSSLKGVDKVVVYGHSLNEIDMPYYKEIVDEVDVNAEWYFSVFLDGVEESIREKEKKRLSSFCNSIGVTRYNIFRMPQYNDKPYLFNT